MSNSSEEKPPESAYWDREALDHLLNDLHRSKSEFSDLLTEEAKCPAFDPLKVRDMIRAAMEGGHHPTGLVLGQLESASFRHFVCRGFGEESGSHLKQQYFMGLSVHEDVCPTRLELIDDDDPDGHTPHLAA